MTVFHVEFEKYSCCFCSTIVNTREATGTYVHAFIQYIYTLLLPLIECSTETLVGQAALYGEEICKVSLRGRNQMTLV